MSSPPQVLFASKAGDTAMELECVNTGPLGSARAGQSCEHILKAYYTGVELQENRGRPEVILLAIREFSRDNLSPSGLLSEIKSLYAALPEIGCTQCGACCVSPHARSPKFIYIMDFCLKNIDDRGLSRFLPLRLAFTAVMKEICTAYF